MATSPRFIRDQLADGESFERMVPVVASRRSGPRLEGTAMLPKSGVQHVENGKGRTLRRVRSHENWHGRPLRQRRTRLGYARPFGAARRALRHVVGDRHGHHHTSIVNANAFESCGEPPTDGRACHVSGFRSWYTWRHNCTTGGRLPGGRTRNARMDVIAPLVRIKYTQEELVGEVVGLLAAARSRHPG